jgi:hypothetical protein
MHKLTPVMILVAIVCWLLFIAATAAGFVTGLGALLLSLVWPSKARALRLYVSRVVHAADCSGAAFLGWSGRDTISKECGRDLAAGDPCGFCNYLCRALGKVDPEHCQKEGSK